MANPADIHGLAATQHGVVATRQLAALGFTRSATAHLVARQGWDRVTPRVLVRAGAPDTTEQRLMVPVLHHGPEAYLTRGVALWLWGVPGFGPELIDLVVKRPMRSYRARSVSVHTSTDLRDSQIATVRGLPVATPARALVDLAASGQAKRVERALDNAWARHLVNARIMSRTIDELARRGRPGITLMRELMAERGSDFRPPESNSEARLNQLLVADGQRPLERQVDVGDDQDWVGRVDLRDVTLPQLLVEVQSALFHGSKLDQEHDEVRRTALRSAGFTVLEIWDREIWFRPQVATDRVRAARAALRRHQAA